MTPILKGQFQENEGGAWFESLNDGAGLANNLQALKTD